jgi:hypothetical protein
MGDRYAFVRKNRKFTYYVNLGAVALFVAAVVALLCTHKLPAGASRAPASADSPK